LLRKERKTLGGYFILPHLVETQRHVRYLYTHTDIHRDTETDRQTHIPGATK